jgi:inhibitor of KinA sporulation pathway (predicted exonuclease)
VTCGDWDLRLALREQCALSSIEVPSYFDSWINIKKSVHIHTRYFPTSLPAMLAHLGLQFEGRHHSGIDDSKNISNVVVDLIKKGFVLETTTSIRK